MPDNGSLYHSFEFMTIKFIKSHFTDMKHGAPKNYIAWMKKGTARFVSAKSSIEVAPGDLFFVPMGLVYKSYWQGDPEIEWDTYGFTCFPENRRTVYGLQKIPYSDGEREILDALSLDHEVNALSVGRLFTLFGMLQPKMSCRSAVSHGELLQKAVSFMTEDPYMPVPEIAALCGVSTSGLYAAFKRELGHTPVDQRHIILCEKAAAMLTRTDTDIETVSALCGFSSSSYFRKVLFKVTGKTPSEIRKSAIFI